MGSVGIVAEEFAKHDDPAFAATRPKVSCGLWSKQCCGCCELSHASHLRPRRPASMPHSPTRPLVQQGARFYMFAAFFFGFVVVALLQLVPE